MDDLILRWAAIDALNDTNLKRNVDSVCDGDVNRTRRAAQRVIAQLPAVDAIPIAWIREKIDGYTSRLRSKELDALVTVLNMYEKEQEAR